MPPIKSTAAGRSRRKLKMTTLGLRGAGQLLDSSSSTSRLLRPSDIGMESVTVDTCDGVKLSPRLFNPVDQKRDYAMVLVHPFTMLDGFQGVTQSCLMDLINASHLLLPSDIGMESVTVDTCDGLKLSPRLFNPVDQKRDYAMVLVHPFTMLDGFQGVTQSCLMDLINGL
ncbi:hypothetical protein KSP40_PGU002186 [Platanthera guangdongensis]|uniref:Uncharacterized protein n=1 Tax=Platanthera guangdongensis TaxID=2320717 RepID=A0ABR2LGY6_9ASPA